MAALFLFVAGNLVVPGGGAHGGEPKTEPLVIQTGTGDLQLTVEIAATPQEQARGLMFRRSLAEKTGMLFAYDTAEVIHMWMRNTYISLDMLFIAADGRIARIARQTEPFSEETISSGANVTAVLEIGGGQADALGIKEGDRVVHAHFKTVGVN